MDERAELAGLAADLRRRLALSEPDEFRASAVRAPARPAPSPARPPAPPVSRAQAPAKAEAPRAPSARAASSAREALADEAEAAEACRRCPLGESRIKAVYGVGSPEAQVVFVGEGPGFEEDRKGEPFVGPAGKLLDKILASVGLSRETVYIANMVKCHPMLRPDQPESRGNDRPPTPEEMAACRPFLDRQLDLLRPRAVVTLGAVAARGLLGHEGGLGRIRGRWHELPRPDGSKLKVLPTYHPAALLRNPDLKRSVWEDMKRLKSHLQGEST